MTSSRPIESLCVCIIKALPTHCLEARSNNKNAYKILSRCIRLRPLLPSFPAARTCATFSCTCQLHAITTVYGWPSPWPPGAAGRSGGEGRLEQVRQQQFAFQGLVSIISRKGEKKGRGEEWVYEAWLEGVDHGIWIWWCLSVPLYVFLTLFTTLFLRTEAFPQCWLFTVAWAHVSLAALGLTLAGCWI